MLALRIPKIQNLSNHFIELQYSIESNIIETITTFSRPIATMNEDGKLIAMKCYMKDPHHTEYWICKCKNRGKSLKGYISLTSHIK